MKSTRSTLLIPILALLMVNSCDQVEVPEYKNANLPTEKRVADLLSRMTLEEKAAQMIAAYSEVKDSIYISENGEIIIGDLKAAFPHGVGQVTRLSEVKGGQSQTSHENEKPLTPRQNAMVANKLQKYFMEETRLGIPVIFHEECLHGLVASHTTSFPHPIAICYRWFQPSILLICLLPD